MVSSRRGDFREIQTVRSLPRDRRRLCRYLFCELVPARHYGAQAAIVVAAFFGVAALSSDKRDATRIAFGCRVYAEAARCDSGIAGKSHSARSGRRTGTDRSRAIFQSVRGGAGAGAGKACTHAKSAGGAHDSATSSPSSRRGCPSPQSLFRSRTCAINGSCAAGVIAVAISAKERCDSGTA